MEQDTKKTDFAEQNEPTAQPQEAAQQGGEVAEAHCKSYSKPKENGPMTAQQRPPMPPAGGSGSWRN